VEVVLSPRQPAAAGRPEVPPGASIAAADVDLTKIDGIPGKVDEAVRKATGNKWGMEVRQLRLRSDRDELAVMSSVNTKVIVDLPVVGRQEKLFKTDLYGTISGLLNPGPNSALKWKIQAGPIEVNGEVPAKDILGALNLEGLF